MRHGEYKEPGGKLVIVDFSVRDGRIVDVQINGDFFLEPPETLTSLNHALEGMPQGADHAELVSALQAAVPAGAELVGFGPAGIATAVRRALQ